jgi:hypothetical protein
VDLIAALVDGLLDGLIFSRIWTLIGREACLSQPMSSGAGEILQAATLRGHDLRGGQGRCGPRLAAEGTRRLTGI